jgi:NAD(P)-dependent dehydrogenase (short-subunit alcohol dehydrogenase family)
VEKAREHSSVDIQQEASRRIEVSERNMNLQKEEGESAYWLVKSYRDKSSRKRGAGMRLENKVAIVTGGSRGIGKGICLRFGEEGASLIINHYDTDDSAAARSLQEVEELGVRASVIRADIRDEKQVEGMVERTIGEYGKVDVLVNNAGVLKDHSIKKMTIEDWDYVLDTNLKGAFLCTRAVAAYMKSAKYGKIINIGSRAMWGNPCQANYTASKGGLVSMTRGLALELARYNINVNCVAPGLVYTEMVEKMKQETKERLFQAQLTGMIGTPRDIANVVLFLASDEARYIVGETILADGGRTLAAGSLGRVA